MIRYDRGCCLGAAIGVLGLATTASGQQPQQQQVPVLSTTLLATTELGALKSVMDVRSLSDGRVFVNDTAAHRILLFERSLTRSIVAVGPFGEGGSRYGSGATRFFAYRGDSSVLVDAPSGALVVIGPRGSVARVAAPPFSKDLFLIGGTRYGNAGFDPLGRLVYEGGPKYLPGETDPLKFGVGKDTTITTHTIGPIVRADFDTRAIDTIGWVSRPLGKTVIEGRGFWSAYNPMPVADQWVLLADGAVAMVRANDYHIDWVFPDGHVASTPRMPMDWRRVTTEEKEHTIDSVKGWLADEIKKLPSPPQGAHWRVTIVDPSDLPDYYPPLIRGQVRGDPAGNVWIAPATSRLSGDGVVFDVVNREGVVVKRVRLPAGRALAGFDSLDVLYVRYATPLGQERLERRRVNR